MDRETLRILTALTELQRDHKKLREEHERLEKSHVLLVDSFKRLAAKVDRLEPTVAPDPPSEPTPRTSKFAARR